MNGLCPWSNFVRATYSGCEPDVCGWIIHPAEAWSGLAYLVVAAALFLRYRAVDRTLPVSWLPLIVAAIGTFSILFHASMTRWLHVVDLWAIFFFTGFLLAANLEHGGLVRPGRFPTLFIAVVVAGLVLALLDPRLGYLGLGLQGLGILGSATRIPARGPRVQLFTALGLLLLGVVALVLDHRQLACSRGELVHVLQPHSLWHILSGISLFAFYGYERRVEHNAVSMARARVAV